MKKSAKCILVIDWFIFCSKLHFVKCFNSKVCSCFVFFLTLKNLVLYSDANTCIHFNCCLSFKYFLELLACCCIHTNTQVILYVYFNAIHNFNAWVVQAESKCNIISAVLSFALNFRFYSFAFALAQLVLCAAVSSIKY